MVRGTICWNRYFLLIHCSKADDPKHCRGCHDVLNKLSKSINHLWGLRRKKRKSSTVTFELSCQQESVERALFETEKSVVLTVSF